MKQQRFTELRTTKVGWQCDDVRQTDANDEQRHKNQKSGDWPCDADIEELALRCNRLPDADHRAECARQRQVRGQPERNEVGKRGVDTVVSTREIVSELMGPEYRDDAEAVQRSVQNQRRE